MSKKVHIRKPQRTCSRTETNYKNYKNDLQIDFNSRCGYCDDLDIYNGGKRNYHIDHFKPQKHFPELKAVYQNLVYSCPFCNRAKWDKWQEENGFIDPCSDEYDLHLKRDEKGRIYYVTFPQGEYIWKNLKLYLRRHELIWMIDKIKLQKKELINIKNKIDKTHKKYIEIIEYYINIDEYMEKYTQLLYKEF